MEQFFKIWRLSDGEDRRNANKEIMDKINEGWLIKQMQYIPSANEGNHITFSTSLAVLFEKEENRGNDGRD